jgi:outer membrane biogenesis lipoprotein LolB
MRHAIHLLALLILLLLLGCGLTTEEQAMKTKCESLVKKGATTNEVVQLFGAPPKFTYTRSQALDYLQRQGGEFWQRMSQYPLTYSFPMYSGDVLVYFDETGTAVAYHLNVQL